VQLSRKPSAPDLFHFRDGNFLTSSVIIVSSVSANSLRAHTIAANDDEISVNPIFISHLKIPNVVMIPVADTGATWDVFVAWQRGKTSGPLRALVDALTPKAAK
jgi:hypothetical protein